MTEKEILEELRELYQKLIKNPEEFAQEYNKNNPDIHPIDSHMSYVVKTGVAIGTIAYILVMTEGQQGGDRP